MGRTQATRAFNTRQFREISIDHPLEENQDVFVKPVAEKEPNCLICIPNDVGYFIIITLELVDMLYIQIYGSMLISQTARYQDLPDSLAKQGLWEENSRMYEVWGNAFMQPMLIMVLLLNAVFYSWSCRKYTKCVKVGLAASIGCQMAVHLLIEISSSNTPSSF